MKLVKIMWGMEFSLKVFLICCSVITSFVAIISAPRMAKGRVCTRGRDFISLKKKIVSGFSTSS